MSMFLQKLLEMNIYGSVAALVVMLFRLIFRRFPKKITVLFWLIVGIRFLCPFNFESGLSLMNLIDHGQMAGNRSVVIIHEAGLQDSASEVSDIPKYDIIQHDGEVYCSSDGVTAEHKALSRSLTVTLVWVGGDSLLGDPAGEGILS